MKKAGIFTALLLCVCSSCKTPQYIPVETSKIEYRENFVRDSIFRYDSVFVKDKGDTVFMERYRYLYKDKIIRDSVFIQDTIHVPYPVEIVKQVKAPLSGWQNFQVWCGRIALAVLLLAGIYFVLKLKKKLPL
ncbi:MAG: hypothetical protein LBK94_00860 [Prevotellaceae bacterium]|jgi:hypothetical protein|nr:hypothetical protein [Prevotellaceae bacterium]